MRPNVELRLAKHPKDHQAVLKFRTAVYVEETGRLADAGAMRESFDRFDHVAQYIVAYVDDRPAGSIQVIADCSIGLPCETVIPLREIRSRGIPVEFGHLITVPGFRSTGIAMTVMRAGLAYAVRHLQATHIIGDFFVDNSDIGELHEFYRTIGFEPLTKPYADTRFSGAPLSVIAVLDIARGAAMSLRISGWQGELLKYFFDEFPTYASFDSVLRETGQ